LQILNKPINVLEGTWKTLQKSDPDLEAKLKIVKKSKKDLEGTLETLNNSDGVDREAKKKVEDTLAKVTTRLVMLNEEFDPLGAGLVAVLKAIGDLVEKIVDAAGEVNEELHLTNVARTSIKEAVDRTKSGLKLR
jgi:chromosome segregation ATPase